MDVSPVGRGRSGGLEDVEEATEFWFGVQGACFPLEHIIPASRGGALTWRIWLGHVLVVIFSSRIKWKYPTPQAA